MEIKNSPIHELGVFARRAFKAGEIILRWDISTVISKETLDELSETERCYVHPFTENRFIIVQPPERFVNHSCDNNTVVKNFCDVAIKDIAPGEEITSDYATDGAGLKFNCICGSENCRGTID